jgi:hypothetical protein
VKSRQSGKQTGLNGRRPQSLSFDAVPHQNAGRNPRQHRGRVLVKNLYKNLRGNTGHKKIAIGYAICFRFLILQIPMRLTVSACTTEAAWWHVSARNKHLSDIPTIRRLSGLNMFFTRLGALRSGIDACRLPVSGRAGPSRYFQMFT